MSFQIQSNEDLYKLIPTVLPLHKFLLVNQNVILIMKESPEDVYKLDIDLEDMFVNTFCSVFDIFYHKKVVGNLIQVIPMRTFTVGEHFVHFKRFHQKKISSVSVWENDHLILNEVANGCLICRKYEDRPHSFIDRLKNI